MKIIKGILISIISLCYFNSQTIAYPINRDRECDTWFHEKAERELTKMCYTIVLFWVAGLIYPIAEALSTTLIEEIALPLLIFLSINSFIINFITQTIGIPLPKNSPIEAIIAAISIHMAFRLSNRLVILRMKDIKKENEQKTTQKSTINE